MWCTYGQLIHDKVARIYNGEKTVSSNKWCWENWIATCKKMKLEHFLTPYTDLNVRPETMKVIEENIGGTLDDINQSNILYESTPRVMEIKTKVNKWDLIQCTSFCTAK